MTPDIESTIALCDAYIGDSGTSVTSLFGVAGKPLFIFNNNINTLPEEDDWRGKRLTALLLTFGAEPDIRLQEITNSGFPKMMIFIINSIWILESDIPAEDIIQTQ